MKDYKDLQERIRNGDDLNDTEKQELFRLVSKGCRSKNREKLERLIFTVPVSCWPTAGILSRVMFDQYGVSYCAGQDYSTELPIVRDVLLNKR